MQKWRDKPPESPNKMDWQWILHLGEYPRESLNDYLVLMATSHLQVQKQFASEYQLQQQATVLPSCPTCGLPRGI